MKYLNLASIIVFVLMCLTNVFALKCPAPPVIKDFDLKKYTGTW